MPQSRSYMSLVEGRIAAWSCLCTAPTLANLDIVIGCLHGERKEEVWNVATHIHFHIKTVRVFLHALGELAIEERATFRSFATIEALRGGLKKYGYTEFSKLPLEKEVLMFLYLSIRDGASFLMGSPKECKLYCLNDTSRVSDDFY